MDKIKRLTKAKIAAVVTAAVIAALIIALLITNVFIPVKYLSSYFVIRESRRAGELRVTYLDVGFGDCIVIELPDGKVLMIDGGDGTYSNQLSVLRYLNSRSIDRIDYLVCSSVNKEHCGGLDEIVKYKSVGTAYIPYCLNTYVTEEYRDFILSLKEKKIKTVYASCGEGAYDDGYGYFFTFLSPTNYLSPSSEYADLNSDPSAQNIINASAVTWLEYAGASFVFTSDAGSKVLKRMTDDYLFAESIGQNYCPLGSYFVKLERCTVAQAAGHGSSSSTYARWYDTLNPDKVVISVGKNNADCPSIEALSDICSTVSEPMITMTNGAITVKVTADGNVV